MLMNNRRALWVVGLGLAMGVPMAAPAQGAAKKPVAAVSMQNASLEARIAYVRKLLRNRHKMNGGKLRRL